MAALEASTLISLQRQAGNRAVLALLDQDSVIVQRVLKDPGDVATLRKYVAALGRSHPEVPSKVYLAWAEQDFVERGSRRDVMVTRAAGSVVTWAG